MSLVISKVFTYDTDAGNYIQAVEAADTVALEPAVRQAINNFVVGCKQDGIWDAIKASCILAGARTLSGALVPLKGTAPTNNGPFVAGDYNRKTGLGDSSNTSKYLNSNRANNADPQNNNHNAIYISVANSTNPAILMGDGIASTVGNNRIVFASPTANLHFDSRSGAAGSVTAYPVNPTGFVGHSRSSAGSAVFRVASASTSYAMTSNTPTSTNVHVFSRESGGVPTNARIAFYSIGESLDLQKLDSRVTDLITAFGAAIP